MYTNTRASCIIAALATLVGCAANPDTDTTSQAQEALHEENGNHFGNQGFEIDSPSFEAGGLLPDQYTCQDHNFATGVSPEINWTKGPTGTKSFAMVLVDTTVLDQGIPNRAYHWAIWNIPHDRHTLPEGITGTEAPDNAFPDGLKGAQQVQARGFGRYFAPCPAWPTGCAIFCGAEEVPEPGTDSYEFILYALPEHEIDVPAYDAGANPNYVDTLNAYFASMALGSVSLAAKSNAYPSWAPFCSC